MNFKIFKNDKYQWTQHAQYKMRQYSLSAQRVIRVIRNPERTETGIVENTIAVMQPASIRQRRTSAGKPARSWSQEIWVMYQIKGGKKWEMGSEKVSEPPHPTLSPLGRGGKGKVKIISAWRYPGISPKNNPIPEEILREIRGII